MGGASYFGATHLMFRKLRLEKGRKMHKYSVFNGTFGQTIGEIHWRGGWRQYVFEAKGGIDMSCSCQKEIIKFTEKLMGEWRKKRAKNRVKDVFVATSEGEGNE